MTTAATIPHVLGEATLGELEQGLRGQLVRPEDDGYDEARAIWNGAHDRRPALIVRCAGVADVMRAVDFARSENLLVAVRGGGHSLPGYSTCDGGIVIDLSGMTAVRVDPARRTAVAEGGCTWADFDHETQAFGLAVTGGLVSSTGIAGFTLGGGIGWLMRKVGLTCDNLLAADVVTADGQLVHASEDENPELLWGLRGGGGNFGIATSLEFRLHPVGPMLLAGPIFFAGDRAEEVLRFYRDWVRELPDELTTLANLTTAPPAPFLPEAVHGKPIVAIVAVHAGEPEHGRALVAAAQGPRRPDRRPHRRHALHGDAEPARRRSGPAARTTTCAPRTSTTSPTRRSPRPSPGTGRCPHRTPRSTSTTSAARWPAAATKPRRSATARRSSCST